MLQNNIFELIQYITQIGFLLVPAIYLLGIKNV